MSDIIIKVENLTKIYPIFNKKSDRLKEALSFIRKKYHSDFYALNNINFDVNRGETIGIIGQNGSGKSTLLKILSGVLTQTSGDVQVNGRISALLELGAGFNPEMTGLENIYLNCAIMGYTREEIDKKVDPIIDFADIGEFINQPVKMYSSGMFARLAFAVAINVQPDVLIVDEALSVGDVFFQNKSFQKFEELRQQGTSIIVVSHDMVSIKQMCSRVLWIDQGQQRMFDECTEVCNKYFNEQTRRMNEQNQWRIHELTVDGLKSARGSDQKRRYPRITPRENSILSEKAEILSVVVENEYGAMIRHMTTDQYYTIIVAARFHEKMDKVIIGFVFENKKGITVLAENTYSQKKIGLQAEREEIIEVRFTCKLPQIRSDTYEISPAIAIGTQESHMILTWLHGVSSVLVERPGYELSEVGTEYKIHTERIEQLELYNE